MGPYARECGRSTENGKGRKAAGSPLLMPIILATQEAEIRRIMVQSQPRQIILETLS
jgi:hypothetical protein